MTQPNQPKCDEKFIVCDCHSEFLRLSYDEEIELFDVSVWTLQASSQPGWRMKLAWIWRILTKGSPYGDQLVIDKDKAKEISDYILNKLASESDANN
jgi:hypothetical protein